jgi:dihydropyrimidinase
MSTQEGVELVKSARSRGLPVYSETCTHYLTFNDEMYSRPDGINYIISPPLRKNDDIDTLWQGIKNRSVLITGSDHAAYSLEQKEKNSETFVTVPNGAGGVEARLPVLYSEGVQKRGLSLEQLVDVCCTNAAKLLGMYPKKGVLAPESDADIVIFDPKLEKTLSCNDLHMGSDYTIYEGMKVTGYPITVISKGKVIIEDEAYTGKVGDGEYIHRVIDDEIINAL